MSEKSELCTQNNILNQLSHADAALLLPFLTPVKLRLGNHLINAMEPFTHAYFVTGGLVSVIAATSDKHYAEIGVYGFEGMGSMACVLSSDRCPYNHVVQIGGTALQIQIEEITRVLESCTALSSLMRRYVHTFNVQTAYTNVANSDFLLEERLARWLLMCQDRVRSVDVHITHDFLATMLNVRRPGVTDAIKALKHADMIEQARGRVRILSREKLMTKAGASYGIPEAEYRRLIGPKDIFAA